MGDSKTATERLRELLDERGIEHHDGMAATYWGDTVLARYDGSNPVYRFSAYEFTNELNVHLLRVTPEQAIAATLGAGECEQILSDCDDGLMPPFIAHCSACGAEWGFTPSYCHNCGARVTGTRDERKAVKR